ncbi:PAS domain-containing protein [Trichlorobacter ammonificans]|uniref:PAS domain S-box-containing protein n=1 Tax=Trichlorobacter ammonificans TaxID=2916410 RepID=A0ABM9D9S7_9BACT|nr:PAS domain S-box protein [Trichlorobacter ammonificans]CAH2031500.1 PAS domain S-box-containing protein [Trichlorobacter ammonificans]
MENLEHYLRQTLDAAPDAILISDRQGIIRYWNSGAEQMLGYSAAEAVGQSLDLFIPEKLRGRHWDGYYRVMESGVTKYQTGLLSSPGLRKDGSQVSLEFSMVLLKDESGVMQGCAAIMRDVTARWLKEKELKQKLADCEAQLAT